MRLEACGSASFETRLNALMALLRIRTKLRVLAMRLHPSHLHATSPQARNGAPGGARVEAAPRGRMLPPARASGAARATDDPLAGTICFGRAAPPGAPPRFACRGCRSPQSENRAYPPSGSPPDWCPSISKPCLRNIIRDLASIKKRLFCLLFPAQAGSPVTLRS